PIIPGIKPVTNRRQIEQIPRLFFATMPQELVKAVEGAKTPAEAFNGGTRYMAKLVQQLLDFGVPGIHLFIQEKSDDSHALLSAVYGS
ncbi:MAG: 5,10-methylenetetrahydrofolate reductase, partial [Acidobacteria bacterium]